jgi:hypothetical protein
VYFVDDAVSCGNSGDQEKTAPAAPPPPGPGRNPQAGCGGKNRVGKKVFYFIESKDVLDLGQGTLGRENPEEAGDQGRGQL